MSSTNICILSESFEWFSIFSFISADSYYYARFFETFVSSSAVGRGLHIYKVCQVSGTVIKLFENMNECSFLES